MITLYISDVSGINIENALSQVSELRREKALRCASDDDKRRSLGAALLLRKAVGTDEYKTCENGKPYIDGIHFSLSHSGKYAVCAVSECAVGVDIEKPRHCDMRVARRCFTAEEYRELEESSDPDTLFTRLWVTKESCVKCSGIGLGGLKSTDYGKHFTTLISHDGYFIAVSTEIKQDIKTKIED